MNLFSSIGLFIKGLSLPVKIVSSVIVSGAIVGGVTTTVIINSQPSADKPSESSDSVNAETSTSVEAGQDEKTDSENTEKTDDVKNASKTDSSEEKVASSEKSEAQTSTTNTNTSSTTTQTQQTTTNTTVKTPTKKPDYNLNDKYVAGYVEYALNTKLDGDNCVVVNTKNFFGVTKFTGVGNDLYTATYPQYLAYMNERGYIQECGGMGSAPMTWEDAIAQGIALDEAKCVKYGLSCGRW